MQRIAQSSRKWKQKVTQRRESLEGMTTLKEIDDIDIKVSLIQALIPAGLEAVNKLLQQEVLLLAGQKHARGKENLCWSKQGGSVYLLDQKVPIMVPRVRNRLRNMEVPLESYQRFQQPYQGDEQVFRKPLNGLSTHNYRESAELVPEVFGISASDLSRRFKYATARKLRQLQERQLRE